MLVKKIYACKLSKVNHKIFLFSRNELGFLRTFLKNFASLNTIIAFELLCEELKQLCTLINYLFNGNIESTLYSYLEDVHDLAVHERLGDLLACLDHVVHNDDPAVRSLVVAVRHQVQETLLPLHRLKYLK